MFLVKAQTIPKSQPWVKVEQDEGDLFLLFGSFIQEKTA
jgi:hypothetical protein